MLESIQSSFKGELYFGEGLVAQAIKNIYATDASEYQEKPLAVALPSDINDLKLLINFSNEANITIIPRAAGTSLAGQVVGNGIVVDISKYCNQILELNTQEKWVRVQPGVIRDDLNAYLKPFGLMFGPETSTANRAMIGGMVGNNSCGLHSIIWGNTRDNLLELKVILADGSEAHFTDLSQGQLQSKCHEDTLEGSIYNGIFKLVSDTSNQEHIKSGFPKASIKRRNSGYALDSLVEMAHFKNNSKFNLSKLIAGSEGTLCFISEIKLQLIDLPPTEVAMVAIHTNSIHEALLANLEALNHNCAASELVDDFILQFTKTNPEHLKNRFFIEGDPKAILMVEFFDDDKNTLQKKCESLIHIFKSKSLGYHYPILYGDDSKKAWEVRKGGLGLLRNLPGDAKPVNLIEDCAVDPIDLPNYINDLEVLLKQHNLQYSMYAHAGAGELHVEPIINLKTQQGLFQFRKVLEETAKILKSYDGALSGEHGDGRLRGEFIPYMMGPECYQLFKETKSIFDPKGVFNKGKIVDTPPMDKYLRYSIVNQIPIPTIFDFQSQGGILRLAEKCSGSGDCRKTEITGGTMCPSYMATRSERDTTRARANMLRQFYTNSNTNDVDDHQVKEILDLCLSCKACKSECPSSVDVSKMKAEFLESYHSKHGIPFRTKLITNFSRQMKLASYMPWLYNFVVKVPLFTKAFNKLVGFHPQRSLPALNKQTLKSWYDSFAQPVSFNKVYLFCDEFTNYNDLEIGQKLILLLNRLGYQVMIPNHLESSRSFLSKGMVSKAKEIANQNIQVFKHKINQETPLIGIEPSAILSFKDEYIDLANADLKQDAIQIAQNTYTFEDWFAKEMDAKNINKESFTDKPQLIKLHGHCHQKSLGSLTSSKKALSLPTNYTVQLINSGCCGMAGSFGYETEHYDTSMQIGELVLFPSIRSQNPETIIAASGTSCRHQIKDGTHRIAKHPIEILYEASMK